MRACNLMCIVLLLIFSLLSSQIARGEPQNSGNPTKGFTLFSGSPLDIEELIYKYKDDRPKLTMCLLSLLVRRDHPDFSVRFKVYLLKSRRFSEIMEWERPIDQFEIIDIARKYIEAGADINGLFPQDHAVVQRNSMMDDKDDSKYEYKKGDNAVMLALKSRYDYAAYALYTYTNASTCLSPENRKSAEDFARTNGFSLFLTLLGETDHGLIERMMRKK